MDTDYLSNETYRAVIVTAEMFNHDLTLHFGCLAKDCEDEEEYLLKAEQLIQECLKDEDIEELMDNLFFGNPPKEQDFINILSEIQYNIDKVREIPFEQRTFDF